MVVITVPEGPYAGLPAHYFETKIEMEAAINQGLIADGDLVSYSPDITPYIPLQEANYTKDFAVGLYAEELTVAHVTNTVVVDDNGDIHYGAVVFYILESLSAASISRLAVIIALTVCGTVLLYGAYKVIGQWRRSPVSSVQEIGDGTYIVTYPNGSGVIIQPDTGEIIDTFDAPIPWWLIAVVGGIIVVGVFVLGRPGGSDSGGVFGGGSDETRARRAGRYIGRATHRTGRGVWDLFGGGREGWREG